MYTLLLKNSLKVVMCLLFLGCLLDLPYGYFQLVRFIGMIGFLILAYLDKGKNLIMLFWLSSAILINPFIKVALGRSIWNLTDVFWTIVLLSSILLDRKK